MTGAEIAHILEGWWIRFCRAIANLFTKGH